jgi:ribosomal protein S18 acetylase RimI-like enzyme
MHIRHVEESDRPRLQEIAQRSMESSYSLSPSAINGAVETWYGPDGFAEKLADTDLMLMIVELDEEPVAFSESTVQGERGDVLWLHVDPMYRGQGIGNELYEATIEALSEQGASAFRGRVLVDNAAGNAFYEQQGLSKAAEGRVTIDGESHVENIYSEPLDGEARLRITGPEGAELIVDTSEGERGSKAEFQEVFSDSDRDRRWGYYCSNCESLVSSMDTMGRMECNGCGNQRRPTRWDAAYL